VRFGITGGVCDEDRIFGNPYNDTGRALFSPVRAKRVSNCWAGTLWTLGGFGRVGALDAWEESLNNDH
jgi:hypothetical protein